MDELQFAQKLEKGEQFSFAKCLFWLCVCFWILSHVKNAHHEILGLMSIFSVAIIRF